ncbi:hypothetical protein ACEQ8H_001887 [Pleosporales sp. CAS-2024a]
MALSLLASRAAAHTFIWGVYVNGVDSGTFKGIRVPAYNNGPGRAGGYNNGPVKDLSSIDLRCNVLGDVQTSDTIKVLPGDNLTLDWHHDYRNDTDEPIAASHHGPSLIYMSPDPPTDSSFVKIWHQGKHLLPFPQPGEWSTTSDIRNHFGHMNMRIPAGLKAGKYLIRAEMIALHEGEVSYLANPRRGAQFYPDCVQIEVQGDGDVALPEGVGFPGAYSYEDAGIVHNRHEPRDHQAAEQGLVAIKQECKTLRASSELALHASTKHLVATEQSPKDEHRKFMALTCFVSVVLGAGAIHVVILVQAIHVVILVQWLAMHQQAHQ